MLTIGLLLLSTLAAGGTSEPARGIRSDKSSLRAKISFDGPWCKRRPRVRLILMNVSQSDVWIALEKPSAKPVEWRHYAYSQGDGGVVSGGVEDGDFLAFMRSGQGTRLAPGRAQTWVLEIDRMKMRQGRLNLTINGPIQGTANLADDHTAFYDFQASMTVNLVRAGACYAEKGG